MATKAARTQAASNISCASAVAPANVRTKTALKHKAPLALRSVALFELAKGLLVMCVSLGLLSLVHKDIQEMATEILHRLHFDPGWHISQKLLEDSAKLTSARIRVVAIFGLVYSGIRFIETYGLWHERPWAEWFAVISAGLYLPTEIKHVVLKINWINATVFIVNVVILVYLCQLLVVNHRRKVAARKAGAVP